MFFRFVHRHRIALRRFNWNVIVYCGKEEGLFHFCVCALYKNTMYGFDFCYPAFGQVQYFDWRLRK